MDALTRNGPLAPARELASLITAEGDEVDPATYVLAIGELARHDGSVGRRMWQAAGNIL